MSNLTKHKFTPYEPQQSLLTQYRSASVLGLGVMGYSVVRYLHDKGVQVSVFDSKASSALADQVRTLMPEVKLVLDVDLSECEFDTALIVVSPGITLELASIITAKQQGCHIIGDIDLFMEQNSQSEAPVIAITGSNGKSTVTELVGEMCASSGMKTFVGGNIGVPLLDVFNQKIDYEVAVLELSSFQLERCARLAADSVTILNISPDHLDRHGNLGNYLLAKARILRGAKYAVLPRHNEQLEQISNNAIASTFALSEPANGDEFGLRQRSNGRWLCKGDNALMRVRDIPLLGKHNVENVLAAFALVDFLELPLVRVVAAIKSFTGLKHRMETVCRCDNITFVNDSKATNVGATAAALSSLTQPIVWIAGGQGKGADFAELAEAVTPNIKELVLIGEDAGRIQQALDQLLPMQRVDSLQAAVAVAGKLATGFNDCVVLFSPACASFDMYSNFEQRGEDFRAIALEFCSNAQLPELEESA